MAKSVACPKIAFVSSHAALGGSERYLEFLMERLGAPSAHTLVCLADGPFVERMTSLRYSPDVLPTGPTAAAIIGGAWRLRRVLALARPDVIHANGVKAALVAVLATVNSRIPVLWVKHDYSWDGWLTCLIALRCTRVIGVSAAVVEHLAQRFPDRVHVVRTALTIPEVDEGRAAAALDLALGGWASGPVLALVGRIHPVKGHLELIEIAAKLKQRLGNVKLAFIGTNDHSIPEYTAQIQARSRQLEVEDTVCFLGHREDALELVAACDAVIIPSGGHGRGTLQEGFGLVGVEAMAVGTPVVGYANGALPEILGDCALLVPPGDRDALLEGITRVIENEHFRQRLITCGRHRVASSFSAEAMLAAMRRHYNDSMSA